MSSSIFTADRYDRCCHLGDASIYVHCVSKWRLVCTTVFIVVPVNNLPTAPTIFNVVRYVTAGAGSGADGGGKVFIPGGGGGMTRIVS